jgi:hypothetical protein
MICPLCDSAQLGKANYKMLVKKQRIGVCDRCYRKKSGDMTVKINQERFKPKRFKLYDVSIACLFGQWWKHYSVNVVAPGVISMKKRALAYGFTVRDATAVNFAIGDLGKPRRVRVEGWKVKQFII